MKWLLLLLLASCCPEDNAATEAADDREYQLRKRVEELESEMATMSDLLMAAQSASTDIQIEIARFEYDDWKEVVPAVKEAAEESSAALDVARKRALEWR